MDHDEMREAMKRATADAVRIHSDPDGRWVLWNADCRIVLSRLPDCSVDAIVTDPPYGLEFMGKDWDAPWKAKPSREFNDIEKGTLGGFTKLPNHSRVNNVRCEACQRWKFSSNPCACDVPQFPNARLDAMSAFQAWFTEIAAECLRVLKPGGHLLAFGGSRTYHRLACAVEDAGFEIRDQIMWVYGSGFPKSLDVGKAIDKAAGAEREVVGTEVRYNEPSGIVNVGQGERTLIERNITAPATDAAKQWDGWGTALKPAHEPIVVARKPLEGTVAANVLKWGTGALNIDGTRVEGEDAPEGRVRHGGGILNNGSSYELPDGGSPMPAGRWPANFIHDGSDEVLALFPNVKGQVGMRKTQGGHRFIVGDTESVQKFDHGTTDNGSAARFFYCAKAGKKERNAGLEHLPMKSGGEATDRQDGTAGLESPRAGAGRTGGSRNHHPTVKPIALMRYLIRLVTPPGGIVLDPFAGSGTTMVAALMEGAQPWGCEMTDEYVPIIVGRITHTIAEIDATLDGRL